MKLTNTQLKALANQLYSDISKTYTEKKLKERDALISKFEKSKDGKIILYLIDKYPTEISRYHLNNISGANKISIYPTFISFETIYYDLVVASIESKDVKTLTDFVKNKYLKK